MKSTHFSCRLAKVINKGYFSYLSSYHFFSHKKSVICNRLVETLNSKGKSTF